MIRKTILTGVAAIMLFALMSINAAVMVAKADFTGTWELNKSKSEGINPGLAQTMTVKHTDDRIEVELKSTIDGNDIKTNATYVLDGKEMDFTAQTGPGTTSNGKRISKWSKDGNGIDIVEKMMIEGPNGKEEDNMTRHWELSADGKTLTLDTTIVNPMGTRKTKRVFVKK